MKKVEIRCTECDIELGYGYDECPNCGNDEDYIIEVVNANG